MERTRPPISEGSDPTQIFEAMVNSSDFAAIDLSPHRVPNTPFKRDISVAVERISADRIERFMLGPEDERKWNRLGQRIEDAYLFGKRVVVDLADEEKAQGDEMDHFRLTLDQVLLAGAMCVVRTAFIERSAFAQKRGFDDIFSPYAQLGQLENAGGLLVQIDGVSLQDFMEELPQQPDRLAAFYSFMAAPFMLSEEEILQKAREDNDWEPLNQYPERLKPILRLAGESIFGIVVFKSKPDDRRIDAHISQSRGVEREAAIWAKKLIATAERVKEAIRDTIVNPDSPQFSALRDAMLAHLQGKAKRANVLFYFGLGATRRDIKLYRDVKKLSSRGGNEAPFFQLLADSLKEGHEEDISRLGWLTSDDLSMILNGEILESREEPIYDDLNAIVASIFSKTKTAAYTLGPEDIKWGNLLLPQAVRITFNRANPSCFIIRLDYTSETGESLKISLDFDLKNNMFDWSLFDGPHDPDMAVLRSAVLIATKDVLSRVDEQVDLEYKQRQAEKSVRERTLPPGFVRSERQKGNGSAAKSARQLAQHPVAGIFGQTWRRGVNIKEKREPKIRPIALKPGDTWRKKLRSLSSLDKRLAIEDIREFAATGKGRFYPLENPDKDGQQLYALRVRARVRGQARVLFKDGEDGETLLVEDVRYRKDVYKRHGI